jgi:leader peptidase (prepilin peptidase)/N-methyltransferase
MEVEPSLANRSAITIALMVSPVAGHLAAAFIRSNLTGQSLLTGRSLCPECQSKLCWRDFIPLFSRLLSFGACRRCQTPIPLIYPALELAFFAAALWASQLDENSQFLPAIILGWTLITLFTFDAVSFVLPDFLTYSLLIVGLIVSLNHGGDAALENVAGASGGALCLLLVKYAYLIAAKRDGLGMGDVKLFAASGAWVGPEGLPQVLLAASLLGLIYAGVCFRGPAKAVAQAKVPFGAGMCVALWGTWIFGPVLP